MKLISFPTVDINDVDYDLFVTFELSDDNYDRLNQIEFCDIVEMFEHCIFVCDNCFNIQAFSDLNLKVSNEFYNHTDDKLITPKFG